MRRAPVKNIRILADQIIEKPAIAGALLFTLALLVYMVNGVCLFSIDTLPASHFPLSLIHEGNTDFNEFTWLFEGEVRPCFIEIDGHYYSRFPVGSGLVATPLYYVFDSFNMLVTKEDIYWAHKLSAAILAALSVLFMYLFLCNNVRTPGRAFILAFIFAFCTGVWSINSQALWQSTGFMLCWVITLWLLFRTSPHPALAGMFLALAVLCRPPAIIFFPILALTLALSKRRVRNINIFSGFFLVSFIVLFLLFRTKGHDYITWMIENYLKGGNPLLFLAGNLFSPSRGLFVYSPVFILAVIGLFFRVHDQRRLYLMSIAGSALYLLSIMFYRKWWGGYNYGPRYLVEIVPFMILLLDRFLERFRGSAARVVLGVFVLLSAGVHYIGTYYYNFCWDYENDVDNNPMACFQVLDSQPLFALTRGRVHHDINPDPEYYLLNTNRLNFGSRDIERHLYYGFWKYDTSGRWVYKDRAELLVKFPFPTSLCDITMHMRCRAFQKEWQQKVVKCRVNGRLVGTGKFMEGSTRGGKVETFIFEIPRDFLSGEIERIEFSCTKGDVTGFIQLHYFRIHDITFTPRLFKKATSPQS